MLRIQTHAVCGLPNTRGQNAAPEGQFQTVRPFANHPDNSLLGWSIRSFSAPDFHQSYWLFHPFK